MVAFSRLTLLAVAGFSAAQSLPAAPSGHHTGVRPSGHHSGFPGGFPSGGFPAPTGGFPSRPSNLPGFPSAFPSRGAGGPRPSIAPSAVPSPDDDSEVEKRQASRTFGGERPSHSAGAGHHSRGPRPSLHGTAPLPHPSGSFSRRPRPSPQPSAAPTPEDGEGEGDDVEKRQASRTFGGERPSHSAHSRGPRPSLHGTAPLPRPTPSGAFSRRPRPSAQPSAVPSPDDDTEEGDELERRQEEEVPETPIARPSGRPTRPSGTARPSFVLPSGFPIPTGARPSHPAHSGRPRPSGFVTSLI